MTQKGTYSWFVRTKNTDVKYSPDYLLDLGCVSFQTAWAPLAPFCHSYQSTVGRRMQYRKNSGNPVLPCCYRTLGVLLQYSICISPTFPQCYGESSLPQRRPGLIATVKSTGVRGVEGEGGEASARHLQVLNTTTQYHMFLSHFHPFTSF